MTQDLPAPSRTTDRTPGTLTIRQMCDMFDVTPRTLRFYEAKELLFPLREGTRRMFTRRDRARLELILRGKRFGFSLEEMRQLLDLYAEGEGREAQIRRACEMAEDHLARMRAQRAALEVAMEELAAELAHARGALTADPAAQSEGRAA